MLIKASNEIQSNMTRIAKSLNVIANKLVTGSYDEAGLKAAQQSVANANKHCVIAYKQVLDSMVGTNSLVAASSDKTFDRVVSQIVAVRTKADIIAKVLLDEMPAEEAPVTDEIEAPEGDDETEVEAGCKTKKVKSEEDETEMPAEEAPVTDEIEAPEGDDEDEQDGEIGGGDDMTDVDLDMEDDSEEEEVPAPAVEPKKEVQTAKTAKKASTVSASSNSSLESMWNFIK